MSRNSNSDLAVRVYAALLQLYPKTFREQFGAELVEGFESRLRKARKRAGYKHSAAFWLWIARDFFFALPREHIAALRHTEGTVVRRGSAATAGIRLWDRLTQDLRYAVRSLARRRLFAAVAIGTLGLGIGSATAIYSIVDGVLLADLPYDDPQQLANVWTTRPERRGDDVNGSWWDRIPLTHPEYVRWRDGTTTFESVAFYRGGDGQWAELQGFGAPKNLSAGVSTASLAQSLGVDPIVGRWFLPSEEVTGSHFVVVLSFDFWQSTLAGDPDVLGSTLTLNEENYTVVGVLPSGFRLPKTLDPESPLGATSLWHATDLGERDIWLTLGFLDAQTPRILGSTNWEGVGRLLPGVSPEQALAETTTLIRGDRTAEEVGVRMALRSDLERSVLWAQALLLMVPAGLLLVIACGNVAALLIGESVARRHEMATRAAVGAGRGRILQQLITEGVSLGVMGSAVGVTLAFWGTRGLLALAPPTSRVQHLNIDGTVLAVACALGAIAGLIFGLAPAVVGGTAHATGGLRDGGRSESRRSKRFLGLVVATELAFTAVVLVSGGLLARSLANLFSTELGFDPDHVVVADIRLSIPHDQPDAMIAALFATLEHIEAMPGVERASTNQSLPFYDGGSWPTRFELEDNPVGPDDRRPMAHDRIVTPGYFDVMGMALLEGRPILASDGPGDPAVVVVSESMARRYWPGRSPVGTRIELRQGEGWLTVVGVVGDVVHFGLDDSTTPTVYRPYSQAGMARRQMFVVARTAGAPRHAVSAVREGIQSAFADTEIYEALSMTSLIARSATEERLRTFLVAVFGIIAVILAAAGIFGVTARSVAQRAREMGIRKAMGACESGLIGVVFRGNLFVALGGTSLGLVGALLLSRFLSRFLFGVEPWDPATYLVVGALLISVTLLASFVPARRIARVDPVVVLRAE